MQINHVGRFSFGSAPEYPQPCPARGPDERHVSTALVPILAWRETNDGPRVEVHPCRFCGLLFAVSVPL